MREKIVQHTIKLASQHNKPNIIFKELLHYVERQSWVLPAYSVMQNIIGQAMNKEALRLTKKINRLMPKKTKSRIDALLATGEDFYGITELKKDIKNFSNSEIKKEIKKRDKLAEAYVFSKKLLPQLKISRGNIAYYASLAEYHTPYKLKRMSRNLTYLYFLCYAHHRVQKLNDNLVLSFIYRVSKCYEEAVGYGKTQFLLSQKDFAYDREKIGTILGFFGEKSFKRYKFDTVAKKAHKLIPKLELTEVSKHFKGETKKETEFRWGYFEKNHQSITLGIKPLFMAIEFECDEANNAVVKASKILKDLFNSNRPLSQCDTNAISRLATPKNLKTCFQEKTPKRGYKDAFLVYDRLRKYLNNNKVYFNESLAFKSFNEDIKITDNWRSREKQILRDLALPKLSMPIKERLEQLEAELEQAYIDVNERIKSGENNDITVKPSGAWTLSYPKLDKEDFEHPFFRKLKIIEIGYVFDLVEKRCKFMQAFSHHLSRYDKKKPYYKHLKASIIANGTWQGNYIMASRSNLDFDILQRTEKDRLQVSNIKAACDIISQEIAKLDHFQRRNRCEHGYYGSMDGSKHIAKRETIKARYSKKYFGLMKGVVSLNLIINEVPVNCDILGANEYEGHYLYDLYHGNTSGIDASILSTDTAGSNQVNFSILDNIDVAYAPAYKSMFDRAQSLSGFKQKASYDGMLINPNIVVPKKLIIEHESEIKRIYASLYLNETSQQIIVQKICCRERQTQLKKAMWAYNNIFFSLHALKYIDNKNYKRVIRKSLNDGERYNRLFNAVVNVGGRKVRGLSEVEITVWHHCTRLLTLIIIYYNTYIISRVDKQRLEKGDKTGAEKLREVSSLAVRHINLGGIYHYSDEETALDVDAILTVLNCTLDDML